MITKFYLVSLRGRQHSCGSSSPLAVQHPAWSGRRPQPRRPFFPAAQSPNWTAWAVPIINVSVASACLAAVLVVGASFLARVSETRRRSGAAWGGRRRRMVQLMGVDLAVQFLSLVFFLVPSAIIIAHPCSWFLVQTQVLQLSFLQLLIFLQLLNFLLLNSCRQVMNFLQLTAINTVRPPGLGWPGSELVADTPPALGLGDGRSPLLPGPAAVQAG